VLCRAFARHPVSLSPLHFPALALSQCDSFKKSGSAWAKIHAAEVDVGAIGGRNYWYLWITLPDLAGAPDHTQEVLDPRALGSSLRTDTIRFSLTLCLATFHVL